MKLIIKTEFKKIEIDDIKQGKNPQSGNATFHPPKKVKILNPIDEEMLKGAKEFADNFVTEARLQQGIQVMQSELLLEPTPENTGHFIKWIVNDVFKEERENMLVNNLDPKKVAREIGTLARIWYLNSI